MPQTPSPEVSVIIPAYNTAGLIGNCLKSVFAQTHTDFEVIVVNDGSPDTAELEKALSPYLDKIVYIRQENKRAAGARNTAIRGSQGDLLAFLDSDDAWLPDHLASQIELFRRQPELDLAYADSLVGCEPKQQWRFMERCPSEGEPSFEALVLERCQIPVSTVVARRRALLRAGLFDENLACFDDYDMWLRTAFANGKIRYNRSVQAVLSGKRPGSLSQSVSTMADAYERILRKLLLTLPLSDSQQELIKHRLAESRAAYQLEEAKCELRGRRAVRARELFEEANRYLRRPDVNLAVLALHIAPNAACRLIEGWNRLRNGR